LSKQIPMAQDITAEADSGGHTDNRPALSLLPTMLSLKNKFAAKFNFSDKLCVGLAGGVATPESAAAAFQMGADYILTGSINQPCIETDISEQAKKMLAQAQQADVAMAPAADMFEIGAKVQVLKRGTMFAIRAEKLYSIYKNYQSFDQVPQKDRTQIEEKFLKASFDEKWIETKEFFTKTQNFKEIQRAQDNPKHKMALVFRSYLGLSSKWAIAGDAT
ncbi:MAG: 2-nitropropane dioxygenase, partial [Desulfobacterales bacterium]|nr:2-nitropropane dioxygenase [Desulfobacterales bacterium]